MVVRAVGHSRSEKEDSSSYTAHGNTTAHFGMRQETIYGRIRKFSVSPSPDPKHNKSYLVITSGQ